jgi:hypothetical protein
LTLTWQLALAAEIPTSPRWRGNLVLGSLLWVLACHLPDARAQDLNVPSWAPEAPAMVQVVVAWDWTGISIEEQEAIESILNPMTNEELERTLLPEQIEQRHRAAFVFCHPEQHLLFYPQNQTPEQVQAQQFAIWAICQADQYSQLVTKLMTEAELQADQTAAWVISHPVEFEQFQAQFRTREQIAADEKAAAEAARPVLRPKPIYGTLPASEAAKLINQANPQP